MRRILVTGASGLLGSTLVPALKLRGHELLCLGHTRAGDVNADLTDLASTRRALDAVKPDAIVNLAALTDVDRCEREPALAHIMNTRTVENLANWIRSGGRTCHLVQVSTDQVYHHAGPHAEHDVELINYYAFSKYAGELVALNVGGTALRTNLFGLSRCPGRQSISDWVLGALRRQEPIRMFEDVWFSPLSLETLSEYIGLVVERGGAGVFNLGSRDGMSKADFALRVASCFGLSTANVTRGSVAGARLPARRPTDMRMDCTQFEARFTVTLPTLESEIARMKDTYASEH